MNDAGQAVPVEWILPGIFFVVWALSWFTPRRVRLWFIPGGAILSLLFFLLAIAVTAMISRSNGPCKIGGNSHIACADTSGLDWLYAAFVGLLSWAALAIAMAVLEGVISVVKRSSTNRGFSERPAGQEGS